MHTTSCIVGGLFPTATEEVITKDLAVDGIVIGNYDHAQDNIVFIKFCKVCHTKVPLMDFEIYKKYLVRMIYAISTGMIITYPVRARRYTMLSRNAADGDAEADGERDAEGEADAEGDCDDETDLERDVDAEGDSDRLCDDDGLRDADGL